LPSREEGVDAVVRNHLAGQERQSREVRRADRIHLIEPCLTQDSPVVLAPLRVLEQPPQPDDAARGQRIRRQPLLLFRPHR
jgi:hypothetical protein